MRLRGNTRPCYNVVEIAADEVAVYRKYPFHGHKTMIRFSPFSLAYEQQIGPNGDLMRPALVLVDGEHYPAVVRAAIEQVGTDGPVVAALLLGGVEKLDGEPDYGVPLEHVEGAPGAAMVEAAQRHGAERVVDLSDEPVLDERSRFRLIAHALAAGNEYSGADFAFRPPPRHDAGVPALAVVGTAKRIGKTAVSGHVARLFSADRRVVVVAMGRGGPADPGGRRRVGHAGRSRRPARPLPRGRPRRLRLPRGCRARGRRHRGRAAVRIGASRDAVSVERGRGRGRRPRSSRTSSSSKGRVPPFRRWRRTARCW